jgi:hypothetical protein
MTERGSLWECRDLPEFPRLLMQAVEELRAGTARRASGLSPPDICRRIEFLFVGGGDADRPGLAEALAGGSLPYHISPEEAFVGEAGGLALLRQERLDGLVIDVGQTAIKISAANRRLMVPRDFERLPLAEGKKEKVRAALREFVAEAIRRAGGVSPLSAAKTQGAYAPRSPWGIVLALPCELDDDCVPGPCSYAGLEGDTTFVEDILRLADMEGVPALVLNDAELAAASARLSPHVPADRITLVLTLGFGVGGALLRPGEGHAL